MAGFRIDDCTSQRAPGRLIRRIDKAMRALVEERLAKLGISYPQWATLKLTREGLVRNASELGRELDYTSGATTRTIDALEDRGWITRCRDHGDRRVVRLEVTPAGAAIADRGMSVSVDLWNEMIANFSQDEADQFVRSLVKLQDTIARRAATLADAAE